MAETRNLFLYVPSTKVAEFKESHIGASITNEDSYYEYIVYLDGETKKEIATHGKVFATDDAAVSALANRIDTSIGTPADASTATTLYGLIAEAKAIANQAVAAAGVTLFEVALGDLLLSRDNATGVVTISSTDKLKNAVIYAENASTKLAGLPDSSTVKQYVDAVVADAKEDILTGGAGGEIADAYDTLLEVANWIKTSDSSVAGIVTNLNALNTSVGTNGNEKTGLYKLVADASADALNYTDEKIAALNADVISTDASFIQVNVVEADGVITGVNVTETISTVTYTAKTSETAASLTATDGLVQGSDIAKIKNYVDAILAESTTDFSNYKTATDSSIDNLQELIGQESLDQPGKTLVSRLNALEAETKIKVVAVNEASAGQYVTVTTIGDGNDKNVSIGTTLATYDTTNRTFTSGLVTDAVMSSYVDDVFNHVWAEYNTTSQG